ncbi:hypothetical protein BT96DRAFT_1006084 [Gymnopus androsaceus JB14]|uniref:Uncharacterized protein n=1 Tax=Gymnopus androsaceus JB14 TaxID=1447944 RepID=A0A6A4GM78_9AGAR|nr:hypothetical protein BT96DRAFT_1006084 [Gymnopus androsaceus JB14]
MARCKKYHSSAAKQAANRLKSLAHYHWLSPPEKKPLSLSYHMNTLRKLHVVTYQIFATAGNNPETYHKYVAMLFKDFMKELDCGGTFHYLNPFLPPLTELECELDGVFNCVLRLAGPTSEDLAQVDALSAAQKGGAGMVLQKPFVPIFKAQAVRREFL